MLSFSKTEIENRKRFFKGLGWCILWLSCQNEKWVPGGRNWLGCWRWRCWCRATNLSVWFMQEKIGFWFSHHVSKYNLYVVSKEFNHFLMDNWLVWGLEKSFELCFRADLIIKLSMTIIMLLTNSCFLKQMCWLLKNSKKRHTYIVNMKLSMKI